MAALLVFPAAFAEPARVVHEVASTNTDARPLFILLDGTWDEARKMFRQSPYLQRFPVLSLDAAQRSRYTLRRAQSDTHFCTAEVGAMCLALADEQLAAQALDAYLNVYTHRYLQAKQQRPVDVHDAVHARLREVAPLCQIGP